METHFLTATYWHFQSAERNGLIASRGLDAPTHLDEPNLFSNTCEGPRSLLASTSERSRHVFRLIGILHSRDLMQAHVSQPLVVANL